MIFLSAPNTIPEFLLIIVGFIIVMSIVGVLIGTAKDKVENFVDKQRRDNVEMFSNKEINTVDDHLRYSFGSPGETSRVLTKNYFSLFFDNKVKSKKNMLALLHFRNNALVGQGIGLSNDLLDNLASRYSNNVSGAIFAMVLYENTLQRNDYFIEPNFGHINKVVLEEYNKIAPRNEKEDFQYNRFNFSTTRSLFQKHGIYL